MKIKDGPDFTFKDFSPVFERDKDTTDEVNGAEEVGGYDERNECDDSTTFPAWVISGVAGDYAKLYSAHIEPPIEFFYMSFLVCLGNVLADRLTAASEIYPQPRLYVLLVGESADERKSTAIKKTIQFFEDFFAGNLAGFLTQDYFNACWGVGSAEGLQKVLSESKRTVLVYDEFKALIDKCRVSGSVLLPFMNTLFESNKYENHTKTSSLVLYNAYLSLLAASTIETYNRTWDASFTDIGLTNRIFIVPARSTKRIPMPKEIPDVEKKKVALMLNGVLHMVSNGAASRLKMTPEAAARYSDWYNNREKSIHVKRLEVYATRLMLLLAVNDFKIEIDEETVEKALALVNWQLEVRRDHDPIDAETKVAKIEERIRRQLRRVPQKKRELRQSTNADRTGIRIFEWALSNLIRAGDIILDPTSNTYRLSDEVNNCLACNRNNRA